MLDSPVLSGQQQLVHSDDMVIAIRGLLHLLLCLFPSSGNAAINVGMLRHNTRSMTSLRVTCCAGLFTTAHVVLYQPVADCFMFYSVSFE
jgi:hypothetical protein